MARTEGGNICWMCEKACGGCSWSRSFIPVKGWTAKPTKLKAQQAASAECIETYDITACPEYEPTPKRSTKITSIGG